jgi:membrane-associated phospholipid phosphatase
MRTRGLAGSGVLVALILTAAPARAQSAAAPLPACGRMPSTGQLFTGTLEGFRQLPSRESAGILALGGAAALGAHSVDADVMHHFVGVSHDDDPFRPGATIGGTPLELGAAFAAYEIGRARGNACVAGLGADLVQAQLVAGGLTLALKEATRRTRPDGSSLSFPSGHTSVTFASATVLERHFGWKVGLPAYAVATYVAASRVEMNRHYLSDVAFGAAVGIVAGRAVTFGRSRRVMLTPVSSPDGAGVGLGLTILGRK